MYEIDVTSKMVSELKSSKLKELTQEILHYSDIGRSSVYSIALTLAEIRDNRLYEFDGFSSINDYAKQVLGYKSASVNNMLRIAKDYIDEHGVTLLKHDADLDFSPAQVTKMLPLGIELSKELCESGKITTDLSCRDIQKIVKEEMPENKKRKSRKAENKIEIQSDMKDMASQGSADVCIYLYSDGQMIVNGDTYKDIKDVQKVISNWYAKLYGKDKK